MRAYRQPPTFGETRVCDPLSTHSVGALKQTVPADEAGRVLRRLEIHNVPKHASWLNMVEIESGVLASQGLDRRIESYAHLRAEVAAWEKQRNVARARMTWSFTTERGPRQNEPRVSAAYELIARRGDTANDGIRSLPSLLRCVALSPGRVARVSHADTAVQAALES